MNNANVSSNKIDENQKHIIYTDFDKEVIESKFQLTNSIFSYLSYQSIVSKRAESITRRHYKVINLPCCNENKECSVKTTTNAKVKIHEYSKCIRKTKSCRNVDDKRLVLREMRLNKRAIPNWKNHSTHKVVNKLAEYKNFELYLYNKKSDEFYVKKILKPQYLNPVDLHLNPIKYLIFYQYVFPNDSSFLDSKNSRSKPVSIFGELEMIKRLVSITYHKKKEKYTYNFDDRETGFSIWVQKTMLEYYKEWLLSLNNRLAYEWYENINAFATQVNFL